MDCRREKDCWVIEVLSVHATCSKEGGREVLFSKKIYDKEVKKIVNSLQRDKQFVEMSVAFDENITDLVAIILCHYFANEYLKC